MFLNAPRQFTQKLIFHRFGHSSRSHVAKCHVQHIEESASHPLPLLEGEPQVVLEAHDIPRRGSGDPLENRFGHMIEFLEFHD